MKKSIFWFMKYPFFTSLNEINTVKPAVAATSIKRDPPLSGHFRAPPPPPPPPHPPPPPPPPPPRTILNANAPLLSVHLSNAASAQITGYPLVQACPGKSVVRWTDRPAMTIAVDLGRKATKQTNKCLILHEWTWQVIFCSMYMYQHESLFIWFFKVGGV